MQLKFKTVEQRRLFVFLLIVVLFIQSVTIPFKHTFRVPVFTAPVTVWKLKYDGSGQITGTWTKSIIPEDVTYEIFQFERPDIVDIRLNKGLVDGSIVLKGEILAWVSSRELKHEMKIAEEELGKARAAELSLKAGERAVDIAVEQESLKAATVSLEAFEPEYERIAGLYSRGLVSASEYQIATGKINLLKATRDLAKARVKAVEAGARTEDIVVAQAEVRRQELALQRAQDLMGKEEPILAPFSGVLRFGSNTDVLLALSRIDTLDATLIMPETYSAFVKEGKEVSLNFSSSPDPIPCNIGQIEFFSHDSVGIRAHILLPNTSNKLRSGMVGYAEILSDRITLLRNLRIRMGRFSQSWAL